MLNQICQLHEAARALLWLQQQPLGTARPRCAPTGPCMERQVWAAMLTNKVYSGEFTQCWSSSCYNWCTEGEMQLYLDSRAVSPERKSPMAKWWKCRGLHKSGFKGICEEMGGGVEDESYVLFQSTWLVDQHLENKEFCNNQSLPTRGKPSESQSPLCQPTRKVRENHGKSLDSRTNSAPFSSEGKTDFCHCKGEALRWQQRFLWHGNQRLDKGCCWCMEFM